MDKFYNMLLTKYNSLHCDQQGPHKQSRVIWLQTNKHPLHPDITKLSSLGIKMGHF